MDMVVAGSADSIMMVEGGALEVSEAEIVEALKVAQKGIGELVTMQEELLKKIDLPEKMAWTGTEIPEDVKKTVTRPPRSASRPRSPEGQGDPHPGGREGEGGGQGGDGDRPRSAHLGLVGHIVGDIEYNALRAQVLDTGLRVDGRKPNVVRNISIDASVLPRAHGSALFTRGQTQALVVATLGTANDVQAHGQHRRREGDHQVVHVALQLPALLDR